MTTRLMTSPVLKYTAVVVVLLAIIISSLTLGAVDIRSLSPEALYNVVVLLRLPRTIAAILSGAALSVSGYILQTVFHNPLGSPNILGVNSAAAFSVVLVSILYPRVVEVLPIVAFAGAMLALIAICIIEGGGRGDSVHTLLLAGIAIGAIFTAGSDFISAIYPDTIYTKNGFRLGSLSGVSIKTLKVCAPIIVIALLLSIVMSRDIEVLSLGDRIARSLGLNATFTRYIALGLCAMLCGASISFSGVIGFTGLMVPHITRLLFKGSVRLRLTLSIGLGAIMVLLADITGRVIFAPHEVPVGVILSFIGVPFFLYLVIKERHKDII